MEEHREMFGRTSLLVLYEFGKPDKLSAYTVAGHKEMGEGRTESDGLSQQESSQKLHGFLYRTTRHRFKPCG